jgi:hypothetical protein
MKAKGGREAAAGGVRASRTKEGGREGDEGRGEGDEGDEGDEGFGMDGCVCVCVCVRMCVWMK